MAMSQTYYNIAHIEWVKSMFYFHLLNDVTWKVVNIVNPNHQL